MRVPTAGGVLVNDWHGRALGRREMTKTRTPRRSTHAAVTEHSYGDTVGTISTIQYKEVTTSTPHADENDDDDDVRVAASRPNVAQHLSMLGKVGEEETSYR